MHCVKNKNKLPN